MDQHALLQLLTQLQGDGSSPIHPTSGLSDPVSLSGLALGEQGFGFGGGGSLLGGGGPGTGGGGGGGVGPDLFSQLLAQLQGGEPGLSPPSQSLLQGIGGGSIPSRGGFGAGGQLQPQQAGVPQGTLGQTGGSGTGQSIGQALGTLKELLGLGRTIGGALASPPTPTSGVPSGGVGGMFPEVFRGSSLGPESPGAFALGQLMTPGEALPGFPVGAAGGSALGGGTFSPSGNILPGLPSPTEFFGPGGPPAGAGELGPAAGQGGQTGNVFGGTGGFGAGLGTLGGLAGALTAPNDPARAFSSLAAAGSLASLFDPTGISEILALVGGGGGLLSSLFGGLFGDGHTQGSHITLPGVAPGGFDTRTAGGTQTVYKSYGEGLGALSPFEQAVQAAKTPESLVAAFNQQYSPFPGQFRVESHGPAGDFMNLGGTPFSSWSPWTAAALQNPSVLANLDVQAGMLGAPAEQPGVISALQAYLPTFPWPAMA